MLTSGFGADNDTLHGAAGNDTLIGRNILVTGGGADHFTLTRYYESGSTATSRDLILEFSPARGDRVGLSAFDARLRHDDVNPAGTANDAKMILRAINGDGLADFLIVMTGLITLHLTDFALQLSSPAPDAPRNQFTMAARSSGSM